MVKAWREMVTIPTYEVGPEEKNPIFLEKRVYQGSSGVVYPYQVIESIADEKTDKEWHAVYLENEYILVMILPELGGRIQMAYDKIKQRHFVYYNHVIKPALVGLLGPWISGGIEFNWPQHHRPSTYMPVDCEIVENADGSVTVWVNEMERMFHQKGMAGFTLRPGCAYLEIQGRVSNRTSLPQTFLWWANPAVEVNDAYQSVFPPDVNAVFDHGKRAVSSFPIATGTYYKMDYSAGVDISNYKNIKVPTSYMAVNSKYDFEGGYENDTHGGMLHVASHHFSPGKKQWTWGNGDFGRAWDRNLTDEVNEELKPGFRPYIELMAGVYTENQPDFSWLMPYEEKQFVQYFMPYRELGIVKQATKDFVFNIEAGGQIKVLATSKQEVKVELRNKNGEVYYSKLVTLSPEEVLDETIDVKGAKLNELLFTIERENRRVLTWQAEDDAIRPIPDAAEAALSPIDTKTNDQLYLTGLHLEQYRHATWSALDYYEEALHRDPNDVRCLNQIGLWYLRRGRFSQAETYLRRAVKIWQKRNPNPYDGEAIFNLALTLKYQAGCLGNSSFSGCLGDSSFSRLGTRTTSPNNQTAKQLNGQTTKQLNDQTNKLLNGQQEAYELFWKSTWNKAWADAGYYEAACISMSETRYEDALDEVERSLSFNANNHKARALKAVVLRKLARQEEALQWIGKSYEKDHFNYGCMFEEHLLTGKQEPLEHLNELMHNNVYNYHELALDYAQAGLWQECIDILQMKAAQGHPMTYYYIGYAKSMMGATEEAIAYFQKAEQTDSYGCFPNRLEDILALRCAIHLNPQGARAPYYLGCLYYDKRQYDEAMSLWSKSAELDPQFPTVWRNLALVLFNKENEPQQALAYMEKAFALDESDARIFMEIDQLRKRLQQSHAERLAYFDRYPQLVEQRYDLMIERATLLNQLGRYEEAMQLIDSHVFHPWEGGEGKVSLQYQICRGEIAKRLLKRTTDNGQRTTESTEKIEKAISLLEECLYFPENLGEGKLYGAQDNDFYYLLGQAYQRLGDTEKAREMWTLGTVGPTEPAAAMYYNDAKPDKIFYAALCYQQLNQQERANGLFYKLINYGKNHLFDPVRMDYFAVSLPDLLIWEGDLQQQNEIHCKYLLALGYAGLSLTPNPSPNGEGNSSLTPNQEERRLSEQFMKEVQQLDINHQGIQALQGLTF